MTFDYEYEGRIVTVVLDYPYYDIRGEGVEVYGVVDIQNYEEIDDAVRRSLRNCFPLISKKSS